MNNKSSVNVGAIGAGAGTVAPTRSDPGSAAGSTELHALGSLELAHRLGFLRCAEWAGRNDLVSDLDSPAYRADRLRDLQAMPLPQTCEAVTAQAKASCARVAAKWYHQSHRRFDLAGEAIAIHIGHGIDTTSFLNGLKDDGVMAEARARVGALLDSISAQQAVELLRALLDNTHVSIAQDAISASAPGAFDLAAWAAQVRAVLAGMPRSQVLAAPAEEAFLPDIAAVVNGVQQFFADRGPYWIRKVVTAEHLRGDRLADTAPPFDHIYLAQDTPAGLIAVARGTVYFHLGRDKYLTAEF